MQQVQFRFVDESFNYLGRQLRVVRSRKGCDGCYFNQKQMPCDDQDQHLIGACSADQRADGEETILVLDGPHLRITAPSIDTASLADASGLTAERYFHCLPGSVHKVTRLVDGRPLIADSEGSYELMCVKAVADAIASDGTPVHKGDRLIYLGSDGDSVTVCVNVNGAATHKAALRAPQELVPPLKLAAKVLQFVG